MVWPHPDPTYDVRNANRPKQDVAPPHRGLATEKMGCDGDRIRWSSNNKVWARYSSGTVVAKNISDLGAEDLLSWSSQVIP